MYQLRKKLRSKNEIHLEISSCAPQKFNGYEFLREELKHYERKNLIPILFTSLHKTLKLRFIVFLNLKFTRRTQHSVLMGIEQLSLTLFNSAHTAIIFFENRKKK